MRPLILITAFGTSDIQALSSILHSKKYIMDSFPNCDTKLAFTSLTICKIWNNRAKDTEFRLSNPQIPDEIYSIKKPISSLGMAYEHGYRKIFVQPLHLTKGEEYSDLQEIITKLSKIKAIQEKNIPFPNLYLGNPIFMKENLIELNRAANAIDNLVILAKNFGATLLLMGHGTKRLSNDIYIKFEKTMRTLYKYPTYITLIEGEPNFMQTVAILKSDLDKGKISKKIYIAPFLVVAGEHAKQDMAGEGQNSLSSCLKLAGFEVQNFMEGLGSFDSWANIYVENIKKMFKKINF